MRVPDSMSYANSIRYMNEAKAKLEKLSTIAATQKVFQKSSDDPSLVSSALVLRSSVTASEGYIKTSENTSSWMENAESAFGIMSDLVKDANNIMLKGLSDTVSAEDRANDYAVQIRRILDQAISIGNTSFNGSYIFSGFLLNNKPFTLSADGTTVNYSGDHKQMMREIAPGVSVAMNSDGVAAFNDFFNALITAKQGLETNDKTLMDTALANLDTSLDSLNQYRSNNGAILKQIDTNIEHMEATKNELSSLLSLKEDANMTEAISMVTLQQTTYQTVLEVGSRAISALNLFDYLS